MKLKRILASALAICVVGGTLPQYPAIVRDIAVAEGNEENVEYENGVKYTAYPSSSNPYATAQLLSHAEGDDIVIQETFNGLPVTKLIAPYSSYLMSKNVRIPKTVTEIKNYYGDRGPYQDINLTDFFYIVDPENEHLGSCDGCLYELNEQGEKATLVAAPSYSWRNADYVVHLPSTVNSIHSQAFFNFLKSYKVEVEAGNKYYTSDDGALYSLNDEGEPDVLISCWWGLDNSEFILPDTVTEIGSDAFRPYRGGLKKVVLPDSVRKLNDYSFSNRFNYTHSINLWADDEFVIEVLNPDLEYTKNSFNRMQEYDNPTKYMCEENPWTDIYGYDESTTDKYIEQYGKLAEYHEVFTLGGNHKGWESFYYGFNFKSLGKTFTVNASVNNSDYGTVEGAGRVGEGQTRKLKAIPKEGCEFDYWVDGDSNVVSTEPVINATKESTLIAYFSETKMNIRVKSENAAFGTVEGGGTDLDYKSSVTITATPTEDYLFNYWEDSDGQQYTSNPLKVQVVKDKTYTAHFISKPTITVKIYGAGTVTGAGKYSKGDRVTLSATPAENWMIDHWEDSNGVKYGQYQLHLQFYALHDETYSAYFKKDTYKVNVSAKGGTVTGGGEHEYESIVQLTADADKGYTFIGYSGGLSEDELLFNGKLTDRNIKFQIKRNTNITANFTPNKYAMTVKAIDKSNSGIESNTCTAAITDSTGALDADSGKYIFGKTVKLTATPATGYDFVCWDKNGEPVSTSKTYTYTIDEKNDIKAIFQKHTVEIPEDVTVNGITYSFKASGTAWVKAIDDSVENLAIPGYINGYPVTAFDNSAIGEDSQLRNLIVGANYAWFSPLHNAKNLTAVYVDSSNPDYMDIDGVVYSKDGKTLVFYPPAHGTTYVIPEGVETVYGFNGSNIEDVTFPSTLKSVGGFTDCDGLTKVILPNGVKSIDHFAFQNCDKIEEVYIPASVTEIGAEIFSNCASLSTVTIDVKLDENDESPFWYNYDDHAPFCNSVSDETNESGAFSDVFTGTIYAPEGSAGADIANKMQSNGVITAETAYESTTVLMGDVNLDGVVDVTDATLLSRYVAGWDVTVDATTADINKDGEITKIDSVILSRKVAGWTDYDSYFTV